jgi:MazG family protein
MNAREEARWEKVRAIWEIIDELRGEPGCPWDRKQTPESVQTYLVEEAHEAAAAVRSGILRDAAEELGDLLFMVFFLIHLYEEEGRFSLEEVCSLIQEKMIRRHPHVFGDAHAETAQEVRDNWERIKAAEKTSTNKRNGGIPESLPALVRAYRMLSRSAQQQQNRLNDLEYQIADYASKSNEVLEEISEGKEISADLLGEVLLSVVNLARLHGLRAEDSLHDALRRFAPRASQEE